jgi:hypothetical protein
MSAVTRPRGPLPRRVYWFRRLLVLAVALALVVGIARLLGLSSGESPEQAAQVANPQPEDPQPAQAGASSTAPTATMRPGRKGEELGEKRQKKRKKRLPQPDGPCLDSDVVVTPLIETQPAGQRVEVVLQVGTRESAACFWEVSPDNVFVTISAEELGMLWSTQHCPEAVPTAEVVARKDKPARVSFRWDGRESDEECSGTGAWVTSGSYLVQAAARGSTAVQEAVFVLGPAATPTITMTPTPTPEPTESGKPGQGQT